MQSKKFRNKTTGEIVTQIPILDIANYEEVQKWSDYDKCKALKIRPTMHVRNYERVFTNERDRLEADAIMDKLGILLCD